MTSTNSSIVASTVFVVDDDPIARASHKWLAHSVGLAVEEYPTAHDYLASVDESRPGCVLSDIRMPQMSGIDLLERIRARPYPTPVILITGHGDVQLAVRAMRMGAFDFIEKPINNQLLIERVQQAITLDQANRRRWQNKEAALAKLSRLTSREKEVFLLLIGGRANKEVAKELTLSIKTVETHRARISEKLECGHIASLVRLATLAGIEIAVALPRGE